MASYTGNRSDAAGARRILLSLGLAMATLLAGLGGFIAPQPTAAQWAPPSTVYLERAGHSLDGYFLDWWRSHSALLGDPITEEMTTETPFNDDEEIVQYFENAALVYLPEARNGEDVRLLPLGRDLQRDIEDRYFMAFAPVKAQACGDNDDCTLVVRTRHTVRGAFQEFWQTETGQLLGAPLSEEFRAQDGNTVQIFENGALERDGNTEAKIRDLGREFAKQRGLELEPITPPVDMPLYDAQLFIAPEPEPEPVQEAEPVQEVNPLSPAGFGPGPQQGGYKEIVISISGQAMWAYEDGVLATSTYVSTGVGDIPETITPLGYYTIHTKIDIQDMEGTLGGEYYFVADVPYVMYFDYLGNALHGAYWHNNFGAPMSHGCVNLPMDIAAFLYEWTPIGASVSVIG